MGFPQRYTWIIGGVVIVALVLGFLAFRPDKLFVDDVADESLADAFTTQTTDASMSDDSMDETEHMEDEPASDVQIDDEDMAEEATPTDETTEGSMSDDEMSDDSMAESSEPVTVASGSWEGLAHPASGSAGIYELDGQYVLRFEDDTEIFNGPDLYVWLLEDDGYDGGTPGAHIDLGTIKGNIGGQNYELPAEYDQNVHHTVLVWCLRFSVGFASAELT